MRVNRHLKRKEQTKKSILKGTTVTLIHIEKKEKEKKTQIHTHTYTRKQTNTLE